MKNRVPTKKRPVTLPLLGLALLASAAGCGHLPYGADFSPRWGSGRSLSDAELKRQLEEAAAASEKPPLQMSPGELRAAIADALNIGPILGGLDARPLDTAVVRRIDREGFVEKTVRLRDPFVGEIDGLLLWPEGGAAPYPAIVGLHGHEDTARTFAADYMGAELARAGYAVLLPFFPAVESKSVDHAVSVRLLRDGYTLMGIRVYESLLMVRYLRSLNGIDAERIGLIGHSGGSSAANLVARLTNGVAAQVSDYQVDYLSKQGEKTHCETVPALRRISGAINDERTFKIPRIVVPYGFQDAPVRDRIKEFFSAVISSSSSRSAADRFMARYWSEKTAPHAPPGARAEPPPENTAGDSIKSSPADPASLIERASRAVKAGDLEAAAALLASADALKPDQEERRRVALLYQDLTRYDRALEILDALTRERPSDASVLGDRGLCKYLKGDAAGAIADLRGAIALDAALIPAYATLGAIHAAQKRYDEALKIYDAALALDSAADSPLRAQLVDGRREALANMKSR